MCCTSPTGLRLVTQPFDVGFGTTTPNIVGLPIECFFEQCIYPFDITFDLFGQFDSFLSSLAVTLSGFCMNKCFDDQLVRAMVLLCQWQIFMRQNRTRQLGFAASSSDLFDLLKREVTSQLVQ